MGIKWNWIGWTKTIFVLISCLPVFFSNSPIKVVEENQTIHSLVNYILVGFILIIVNFLIDKIFRKSIIEKPSWNDNPLILKYPLRLYQLFGVTLTSAGGLGYLKHQLNFSEFINPHETILGLGIGIIAAMYFLSRFRKKVEENL